MPTLLTFRVVFIHRETLFLCCCVHHYWRTADSVDRSGKISQLYNYDISLGIAFHVIFLHFLIKYLGNVQITQLVNCNLLDIIGRI
jgi:hypothetical protein